MTTVRAPSRLALALSLLAGCDAQRDPSPQVEVESVEVDAHAEAKTRLAAWEQQQREQLDFADWPASDGRFGVDPYRIIALPDGRFAASLRGADRVVLLDGDGQVTGSAEAPHDPTDLAWREGELLVVGTGEARVARYDGSLAPLADIELPLADAPRAMVASATRIWVADEGTPKLHEIGPAASDRARRPWCRGPLALALLDDDLLLGNCLIDHELRGVALDGGAEAFRIRHDGPIWSFALGPTHDGARLLALTGIEDHPLDRSDGGFGYIDSFVWIYALRSDADGQWHATEAAALNVSQHGVVTPKWSRWRGDAVQLYVGGYASAPLLQLDWSAGLTNAPVIHERPGLPGTRDAVWLDDGRLLATDPLLDRLLVLDDAVVQGLELDIAWPDDRSFDERLGEALLFTTAMAPRNTSDDQRSRFSCEACHFEGRGDGRVHFTGREFEGRRVHAVSKTLMGLFPNRPHFSRALDRSTAKMVDNEFRVANRHSTLDAWFSLDAELVPWIAELPGWPGGSLDGELLRLAVMKFLLRFSMPSNPATRGRSEFSPLEAEGARLFAQQCERCHEARTVADDPDTRVMLGEHGDLEPWRARIFSTAAPILWASDAYAQTGIEPWVHPDGARVPSLRRLYTDGPYFTNGSARSLDDVLAGLRNGEHQVGAGNLTAPKREALAAFLRLL